MENKKDRRDNRNNIDHVNHDSVGTGSGNTDRFFAADRLSDIFLSVNIYLPKRAKAICLSYKEQGLYQNINN